MHKLRSDPDNELDIVASHLKALDPFGIRTAAALERVINAYGTEASRRNFLAHFCNRESMRFSALVKIFLQRELNFEDGDDLDYKIGRVEVGCVFSSRLDHWSIPQECWGNICLLVWAGGECSEWSLGLVRAVAFHLSGRGVTKKSVILKPCGIEMITWLFERTALPKSKTPPGRGGEVSALTSGPGITVKTAEWNDQPRTKGTPLPPDPENLNDKRAAWAQCAITEFQLHTGTDTQDAVADLLCNLMHWCDRHIADFNCELQRAKYHYEAETNPQSAD